jgi:NAD(P)-dependent dehydrogenase (short-subunit alcohol dehydrogenase family)
MAWTCKSGSQLDYAGKVTLVTGGGNGVEREHMIFLASRGVRTVVMVKFARR